MMSRRGLERRLERLERTLAETVSVAELREALADLAVVALGYIRSEEKEAFLEELLAGVRGELKLAFLDQVLAAAKLRLAHAA